MLRVIIMKKVVCMLLVLLFSPLVMAQDVSGNETSDEAKAVLQARYAQIDANALKAAIAMNSTIEFLQGKGIDASGLVAARNRFTAKLEDLEGSADAGEESEFNESLSEMHALANEFKEDALEDAGESDEELKENVRERLAERDEKIQEAKERAAEIRRNATLGVYDAHLEKVRAVVEKMKDRGINTTPQEETLGKLEANRALLEGAYNTGNEGEATELRREAMESFSNIRNQSYHAVIAKAENILSKAQETVGELENKGMNVSMANNRLEAVAEIVRVATTECGAENYESCQKQLRKAREQFSETHAGIINDTGGEELPEAADEAEALGDIGEGAGPPEDIDVPGAPGGGRPETSAGSEIGGRQE